MSITTYQGLRQAVAEWLMRDDLEPVIPQFIALAEARFNRDLRVRQMITRATAETDSGDAHVTLPGNWLEARTVSLVDNGTPRALEYVTLESASALRPGTGPARFFNVNGNRLEFIPGPPDGTQVELIYYAAIPALSESEPTNWLSLAYPDQYLYGALVHSAPYLRDDERVAVWASLYDRGLEEIRIADERARHGKFSLKMRARPLA